MRETYGYITSGNPKISNNFVVRYLLKLSNVTCPQLGTNIKYKKSYLFPWTTWVKQNGRDSQKRKEKRKKKKNAPPLHQPTLQEEVPRTKLTNNPRMTHKYF